MATAKLTWTDPTTRTDGSPLAPGDIASIDIFDTAAPNPEILIGNVPGGVGVFTTGVLTVGDHVFTGVVKDITGHVSTEGPGAHGTVEGTQAPPSPITDMKVTIIP